jgi:hypothetical protein
MFPDDFAIIKPERQVHERGKNNHQTTRPFRGSSTTQAIHTSNEAIRVDNAASKWIYLGAQKRLRHQRVSDITPRKTMMGKSSVRSKSTVVIQPAAEESNRGHGIPFVLSKEYQAETGNLSSNIFRRPGVVPAKNFAPILRILSSSRKREWTTIVRAAD